MVGKGEIGNASDVLCEKRLAKIVSRALGPAWRAGGCELRRAAAGLMGFLGDHFRVRLAARNPHTGETTTLDLFVKCLPLVNQAKTRFISENGYFKREQLMFQVFEELGGDEGPNRWCPKAYLYDESVLVMPDLAVEGFASKHYLDTLGLQDTLAVAASVARFHAAFANYTTKKTVDPLHPYSFLDDYADLMEEPTFRDSPFLRAAAKLSANLVNKFSAKYKETIPDLEPQLFKLFLEACDSLRDYENTLNVVLHKDLWMNNIMFGPGTVILVDYQCIRYAPPAFDLMMLLYLTTSREFRDAHEKEVFRHYYSVFMKSLDSSTKERLKELGYDEEEFMRWCEVGRMFGMFFAIAIFPYVLMEPLAASRHFDDPLTYEKYCNEDRTEPVFQECQASPRYRDRQIDVTEEFIDRYLLQKY